MPNDASKLGNINWKHREFVTYGDNDGGRILGSGDIGEKDSLFIKDVLLVEGPKHNFLSISQLCDIGFKVTFEPDLCLIAFSAPKNP